jgi:hypothetical protein
MTELDYGSPIGFETCLDMNIKLYMLILIK